MAKREEDSDNVQTVLAKGARGMTVRRDFARDNSDLELEDTRGGEMGGSETNLAHSLTGASAVQRSK
jgi:hypothetical protein